MKNPRFIAFRDEKLSVRWNLPKKAKYGLVLAHGAGAGMDHRFMESLAVALESIQVATLRFQFPYMEAGRRRPDRVDVAVEAWESAVRAGETLGLPLFAGGKSFGGRMAAHWAAEGGGGVRGLVFLGYPFQGASPKPQPQRIEVLRAVTCPTLFLQGDRDRLGPLPLVRPTVRSLGASATLHVVEGGDHGFDVLKRSGRTADDVFAEICQTVLQWMDKGSL